MQKDERIIAAVGYNLKLNCLIFSTGLNSLMIVFIWTYRPTVNCRNALDRQRVRINIILFRLYTCWQKYAVSRKKKTFC